MKRSLLFIVTIALMLGACQKKKTTAYCYVCLRYQTIFSSYQVLAKPEYLYAKDTICNMNEGLATMYVNTHTFNDTIKNSHDTLTYVSNAVQCDIQ